MIRLWALVAMKSELCSDKGSVGRRRGEREGEWVGESFLKMRELDMGKNANFLVALSIYTLQDCDDHGKFLESVRRWRS